jgi:hypothetical protein
MAREERRPRAASKHAVEMRPCYTQADRAAVQQHPSRHRSTRHKPPSTHIAVSSAASHPAAPSAAPRLTTKIDYQVRSLARSLAPVRACVRGPPCTRQLGVGGGGGGTLSSSLAILRWRRALAADSHRPARLTIARCSRARARGGGTLPAARAGRHRRR